MTGTPLLAPVLFLAGVGLVVWSVEEFVERVAAAAVGIGLSPFLLTVVLAGTDLENAVLGGAAQVGELPGVALGTVFGEAAFILCLALGLGGLVAPFEVDLPDRHLLLTAAAPLPLLALGADGSLSRPDGAILVLLFPAALWLLYRWERSLDGRLLEADEEDMGEAEEGRLRRLGVLLLTVVGMSAGGALAVQGTRGLLALTGLGGLAFGATVMSFVASLEEILLTVEPLRHGRPPVAAGNVLGSVVFFVTANAGVLALLRPLPLAPGVWSFHVPFFAVALGAVLLLLRRGTVGRAAGAGLVGLYALYWLLNFL